MTAPLTIRLHPSDNVIVARMDILAGTRVEGEVAAATRVPPGHKILTRAVKKGEALRKYNQIIGFATDDLAPGTHVHTHNCVMGDFERDYAFCADAHPTDYIVPPATFQGYRRADGRAATRNYLGIVTTVNCSAATSRMIARHIEPLLAQFPNIDGVVPLTHGGGCGMAASGLEMDVLRRTLAGYTRHPNMAAVVVLGLGCETNQISGLMTAEGLKEGPKLIPMAIQDEGGVSKTVMRAVGFLKELLPEANNVRREAIPASELILALQCGGSDGYSGISANPALGVAVDLLVRNGGSAVLSETPEIYGAEHLLTHFKSGLFSPVSGSVRNARRSATCREGWRRPRAPDGRGSERASAAAGGRNPSFLDRGFVPQEPGAAPPARLLAPRQELRATSRTRRQTRQA